MASSEKSSPTISPVTSNSFASQIETVSIETDILSSNNQPGAVLTSEDSTAPSTDLSADMEMNPHTTTEETIIETVVELIETVTTIFSETESSGLSDVTKSIISMSDTITAWTIEVTNSESQDVDPCSVSRSHPIVSDLTDSVAKVNEQFGINEHSSLSEDQLTKSVQSDPGAMVNEQQAVDKNLQVNWVYWVHVCFICNNVAYLLDNRVL